MKNAIVRILRSLRILRILRNLRNLRNLGNLRNLRNFVNLRSLIPTGNIFIFKLPFFLFGFLPFLLFLLFFLQHFLRSTQFFHPPKAPVAYLLPKGTSLRQLSLDLKKKEIIDNAFYFRLLARLTGQHKLRSGEYLIEKHHTPSSLLTLFNSGKSITRPITVTEGMNMYEIAELFALKGYSSKENFLFLCKDQAFIQKLLGKRLPSLEGYLFPDTYVLDRWVHPKTLITQMVKRFLEVYKEVEKRSILPPHWKQNEVVTLASIIEKETGAPWERSLISSVFHNRLNRDMPLQTDPTVIYGVLHEEGIFLKNLKRVHLKQRTPYNTYTFKGLPPGPIANPGKEALLATLRPVKSNYFYFVSRNDGTHVFSKTYREHSKAVRRYQLNPKARRGKSWRNLQQ